MPRPQEPPGFPAEIPRPADLPALHAVMVRCTRCDLALSRTQVVPGSGDPAARILFVGEAPGAKEDRDGLPFVGASGRLLDEMLGAAGLTRDEVFIANVVRCRPPGNRNPRTREIRACAGWLAEQIRIISPSIVVTLGRFALQHFIPDAKITLLEGTLQDVEYAGSPVTLYPLLHPAAILRSQNRKPEYRARFERLPELVGTG